MKLWKLPLGALTLLLSINADAATIIDTGVAPCANSGCQGRILSYDSNYPGIKYAASFNLETDTTITDMEVWINTEGNINRSFTMTLYQDIYLDTSRTGQTIFSQNVIINDTGAGDRFNNQWQGLSSLELDLTSGSYWLSLEILENNNYDGYIATTPYGALSTVGSYAIYYPIEVGDVWRERSDYNFAFRISDISPVPIPAAVWLFSSGLLGLVGVARRKKA